MAPHTTTACGVTLAQDLDCWGDGDPSLVESELPSGPFQTFERAQQSTGCGLHPGGGVECNGGGRLETDAPVHSVVTLAVASVCPDGYGADWACALDAAGTLACWGENPSNVLDAPTDGPFVALALGCAHGCALRGDGSIRCWGDDSALQATPP